MCERTEERSDLIILLIPFILSTLFVKPIRKQISCYAGKV